MRDEARRVPKYAQHTCGHCGATQQTINGAWLRWRREQKGVGLREFARRVGLSAPYLSDIERGNRHVTARTANAYAILGAVDV